MKAPEDDTRYAGLAARMVARRADDDAAALPASVPDRAAGITAIASALRARARRRLASRLGLGVAAAAAAVLLALGWRSLPSSGPEARRARAHLDPPSETRLAIADVQGSGTTVETPQGVRPAARGDRIAVGTVVRVPGPGELLLAVDTGTRLRVGPWSRVRLTRLDTIQRFDVESGSLDANVAKVPAGGRVSVAPADAEVEVRGTRFEVTAVPTPSACPPFARTRVTVQEGLVVVRSAGDEVRLPAGSAWPVCPPATAVVHGSPGRTHPAHPAGAAADRSLASAADASTLAEQNDLFAAALAARRRGEVDEAIRWFDRLIARFPSGQLTNSARAERHRLLDARRERAPSQ
jgi:hypothetical protein